MSTLQPVRGTRDILPDEMRRHRVVIDTAVGELAYVTKKIGGLFVNFSTY